MSSLHQTGITSSYNQISHRYLVDWKKNTLCLGRWCLHFETNIQCLQQAIISILFINLKTIVDFICVRFFQVETPLIFECKFIRAGRKHRGRFKQAFSTRWNLHTLNFRHVVHVLIRRNPMSLWGLFDLLTTLMTSVRGVHYIRTVTPIHGHGSVKVSSFWCKWPPAWWEIKRTQISSPQPQAFCCCRTFLHHRSYYWLGEYQSFGQRRLRVSPPGARGHLHQKEETFTEPWPGIGVTVFI